MTASARPQRLLNLAETTGAIADALTTRAGWLDDDWIAYSGHNGVDWRFDVSDLPGALRAWAQTLRAIGEFSGSIGVAFLVADDDRDDVHELSEHGLLELVPCDIRQILEESTATDEVDWGDADDPPPWLEALDFSARAVGHVGTGVDALEVSYVIGTGSAASWSPETPAVLGRFATPAGLTSFATVFSVGSSALSGLADGLDQANADAASLNYTDDEIRARATTRGALTGGGALATSIAGSVAASSICGPGAPACAVVVLGAVGLGGSQFVERLTDRLVPGPGPAEHDPAVVRDHVDGVAPGTILRDVPDHTWDVIEPVEQVGDAAGLEAFEARHPYLDIDAVLADPALIAEHDLPAPWLQTELLASLVGG